MFEHADAEFVICAGDDKVRAMHPESHLISQTDEDMFRALVEVQTSTGSPPKMQRPDSASTSPQKPVRGKSAFNEPHSPQSADPVLVRHDSDTTISSTAEGAIETSLKPDNIFTLVVDPNPKRKTVARYRADEPENVINLLAKVRCGRSGLG